MFLGITASVGNWDADGMSFSLVMEDNPLIDFVELPDTYQALKYCNLLTGVVRVALEMVSFWSNFQLVNYKYKYIYMQDNFVHFSCSLLHLSDIFILLTG